MDQESPVLQATESLPTEDGSKLPPWNSVRSLTAQKECALCGKVFRPWRIPKGNGRFSIFKEKLWNKQTCCSQSCAKKFNNPMSKNQARLKMKAKLREIRHKPIKRGGNGQLLPLAQLAILHALGEGWESEVAVATGTDRPSGFPTCYKIDVANRERKLGFELDGASHVIQERKEQDAKKMDFLKSVGWSVYRVSNAKALHLFSTFTSVDTLLTSLMES